MSEVAASKEPAGVGYNSDHTQRVIPKPCKPFNALSTMDTMRIEPVGLPKGETNYIEVDDKVETFAFYKLYSEFGVMSFTNFHVRTTAPNST